MFRKVSKKSCKPSNLRRKRVATSDPNGDGTAANTTTTTTNNHQPRETSSGRDHDNTGDDEDENSTDALIARAVSLLPANRRPV